MHVEYRITTVPERLQYSEELRRKLDEPEDHVFLDAEKRGSVWNKFRVLESMLGSDSGATHLCMLDDDADVINGFKTVVQMCVDRFPDAIFTFFSGQLRFRHKPANTPYVELLNFNMRGIGCCFPVRYLGPYMDFFRDKLIGYKIRNLPWPHDDAAWKMWALFNKVPVMTTIPNLVKDRELKSSIPGHHITPSSDCWQGYDIDLKQFRTTEKGLCADGRLWDMHLPKDDPLAKRIVEEFSRYKRLKKGIAL